MHIFSFFNYKSTQLLKNEVNEEGGEWEEHGKNGCIEGRREGDLWGLVRKWEES